MHAIPVQTLDERSTRKQPNTKRWNRELGHQQVRLCHTVVSLSALKIVELRENDTLPVPAQITIAAVVGDRVEIVADSPEVNNVAAHTAEGGIVPARRVVGADIAAHSSVGDKVVPPAAGAAGMAALGDRLDMPVLGDKVGDRLADMAVLLLDEPAPEF